MITTLTKNILALSFVSLCPAVASAQELRVMGTVNDEFGPVLGANVTERDANNRIVSATVTDLNGNFSMVVKNKSDKLQFSYTGNKTVTQTIGEQTVFNITMKSNTQIQDVVVKAKRRYNGSGLSIPEKEVSFATQSLNMKDMEGLAFTSADEALQGKIAGLDITSLSGNLGSGTQMRLRGVTSINGNTQPLIVVDDNIFDNPDETFDFTNATEENYAALLSVNPQDIESIDVLKDAAATAIWGAQGANGVISIKTKRGSRGKTRLDYSLRTQIGWQPKGYNMLNGGDYAMLMKEEYFNPSQNSSVTENVNEWNYNKDGWAAEWENWNNNTDWVKAVQQTAVSQYHFLTLTGGGEKATYRVSAGYDHQTGTIIKQKLDRFSTKMVLDYQVSNRIKFYTTFPFTYTKNQKNYDDNILGRALKMAPNMSIWRQDRNGNDTGDYMIMYPTVTNTQASAAGYGSQQAAGSMVPGTSSVQMSSIRALGNPVAIANLAWRNQTTYRISPELKLEYELLGTDDDHTRLKYTGTVYMDIFSESTPKYWPGSLSTDGWTDGNYNVSESYDFNSLAFTTKHWFTLTPHFNNKATFSTMLLRWEMTTGKSNSQTLTERLLPTGVTSPFAGGAIKTMSTANSEWRSMSALYSGHISFGDGLYSFDLSVRADGTTRFGRDNKWGVFPGVSARWNIDQEKWMKWSKSWLSMLSFRPSWGIVGNKPGAEYLYFSKYATNGSYGDGTTNSNATKLDGLQLGKLKWERTASYNLGGDIGFFDNMLQLHFNYYSKKTTDLLMRNTAIPSTTGFSSLAYKNVGDMKNHGWELNIDGNRFLKIGKFSMSANFNIAQNFNKITAMDASVLESINSTWTATSRGTYLQRIQIGNPVGSIYGLRYKGVYQYTYEYLTDMQKNNGWTGAQLEDYINNKFLASGKTAPIATDAQGHVIMNGNEPKRIVYAYNGTTSTYTFQGGDAIYEDVNHDGQINSLDVVYLGNSNPKVTGGFGFTFNYGDWSLKTSFNFRAGCKIVNLARMSVEEMFNAYNQSTATTWRWRKNGDVTMIPRALYNTGYNFQGSDRFVENGDFIRFNYFQIAYNFKKKFLSHIGLNRLQMSVSGQNLFVWSHYSGTDPEHNAGAWGIAYDNEQTPRSKSITINFNVGI